jgi:hypothetical protein
MDPEPDMLLRVRPALGPRESFSEQVRLYRYPAMAGQSVRSGVRGPCAEAIVLSASRANTPPGLGFRSAEVPIHPTMREGAPR